MPQHRFDGLGIEPRGLKQNVGYASVAKRDYPIVASEPTHFQDSLANEAIAIRVEPARGNTNGDIPGLNLSSIHESFAFHNAHAKSSQVVVSPAVHLRQDRCLAADQRALALHARIGDASHDLFE